MTRLALAHQEVVVMTYPDAKSIADLPTLSHDGQPFEWQLSDTVEQARVVDKSHVFPVHIRELLQALRDSAMQEAWAEKRGQLSTEVSLVWQSICFARNLESAYTGTAVAAAYMTAKAVFPVLWALTLWFAICRVFCVRRGRLCNSWRFLLLWRFCSGCSSSGRWCGGCRGCSWWRRRFRCHCADAVRRTVSIGWLDYL